MTPTLAPRPAAVPAARAAATMGVLVAVLWLLEIVDALTLGWLDTFGVSPRQLDELPQIYTAPWLHFGWQHLVSNTLPLFVLGFVVLLEGVRRWLASAFAAITASGLVAWLVSAPGTVTAGASGLVFGWLTYLLARGLFGRNVRQVLVAVVVFLAYGGVLWGVLPTQPGVSWQAHLGGALGGILAAWWLHGRGGRRPVRGGQQPR